MGHNGQKAWWRATLIGEPKVQGGSPASLRNWLDVD